MQGVKTGVVIAIMGLAGAVFSQKVNDRSAIPVSPQRPSQVQKQPPARTRTTEVLTLTTYDKVMSNQNPKLWHANGWVPVILIPYHDTFLYRDPAAEEDTLLRGWGKDIDSKVDGPFYVAYWSTNNVTTKTFVEWDQDVLWERFLGRLKILVGAVGPDCRGVLMDFESYNFTQDRNGGPMGPKAWKNHDRIPERASQYLSVLQGKEVGGYVATKEISRHAGLRVWLRHLAKSGKCLILSENYTDWTDDEAAKATGATLLRGFVSPSEAVRFAQRKGKRAWAWDPKGRVYQ